MSNPKITFYLKAVKSSSKPVIMKFNFGFKEFDPINNKTKYIPLIYNTGVKVLVEDWDKEINLPKKVSDLSKIEQIRSTAINVFNHLGLQKMEVNPVLLKSELDILLGRKKKESNVISLCDFIENEILSNENFDKRTRDHYKVLKGKFEDYEAKNNIKLNTSTFQREHYLNFQEKCKKELGTINSVWGVMKNVKSVLNKIRRKYKDIEVFNPVEELGGSEKVQSVSDNKVYFTNEMIQEIIDFEPKSDKLKNVKLILLTLIFTGCRYSDVFKVIPNKKYRDENISFRYAHFITTKGGGKEVIIPFLKPLEDALKENDGETARKISEPKFNQYVKDLCKEIGLNEEVSLAFTNSLGNKEFKTQSFYSMVSSHIGRRTFITHLINAVPVTILSKITGHSFTSREVIFKYNKITLIQNAVLFVKELKRLCNDEQRKDEFPIQLA